MSDVRKAFLSQVDAITDPKILVVAVELPSGSTEVITNYEKIATKISYYKTAYDDQFRLKNAPEVRVVGFMLV